MNQKLIILLLLTSFSIFSLPTTRPLAEKEYYQYVQSVRAKNFADKELDRLHQSISNSLARMVETTSSGKAKNAARYNDVTPTVEPVYLQKDKDGKDYYTIELSQGVTGEDYPIYRIWDTRVYIYPGSDKKSLDKVMIQMNTVNTTIPNDNEPLYTKEMRKIINPTPKFAGPPKAEELYKNGVPLWQQENVTDPNIPAEDNSDIFVEFYSDQDTKLKWVDILPIADYKPGLTVKLLDQADMMPFDIQKKIYLTYRDTLREVDSKIKKKVRMIELNERRTLQKMTEFN
ncbi:MAG: hypothetical protein SFU98_00975 [Leptospiraceae bacterium]|nr:hypothetical protein [Leptospiraceae bacterium]